MVIIYHWGIHDTDQTLESLSIPMLKIVIEGLKTKN